MFYLKLACSGMKKNRRLYVPYLLTCIGMVMMFYIIVYLVDSPVLEQMQGGDTMRTILSLGRGVIGFFAAIFLFYTNSFLVRRRNREFGLYNILGMNKRDISRILVWETILTALIALGLGCGFGILFSKLAELLCVRIMSGEIRYSLSIPANGPKETALLFLGIFLFLLATSIARVRLAKPLDLLRSENAGEKPPRANWLFAVVGIVLLAVAYYLAVSIEEPLTAMVVFFAAVIMVVAATYLIFISGSVAFCKILQKNKRYYYQPNHFVSVSSMVYRMKRNGAGLASICILSTMVLVMLTSTGSMYIGAEDALAFQYPREILFDAQYGSLEELTGDSPAGFRQVVDQATQGKQKNQVEYTVAGIVGLLDDQGNIDMSPVARMTEMSVASYDQLRAVYIMPISDYNRRMGEQVSLESDQVLLYSDGSPYPYETFSIGGENARKVRILEEFPRDIAGELVTTNYYVFVSDFQEYVTPLGQWANFRGDRMLQLIYYNAFDLDMGLEEQRELVTALNGQLAAYAADHSVSDVSYEIASYAQSRVDFYAVYGSLFFLGILLSIVFLLAMVLIIYYKQISEAYEDQARFAIMQNVGMTRPEIRRSINSQVLTVFLLPLILAGLHLCFAYPLVRKMLYLFGIYNSRLVILVNVAGFLVFGLFYALVYRITSNAYFHIVSGAREKK